MRRTSSSRGACLRKTAIWADQTSLAKSSSIHEDEGTGAGETLAPETESTRVAAAPQQRVVSILHLQDVVMDAGGAGSRDKGLHVRATHSSPR